jgi:DNA-binding CsgD family transcriptional regulator
MPAESIVLDLVGGIYDAANDPQLWPAFLERFAEAAHSASTFIFYYDLANLEANIFSSVRTDSEWWRKYSDYYAELDPWAAGGFRLGLGSGAVATGEMLCPNDTLRRSEFANDFLEPGGVFHECCGVVFREPRGASVISCLRPRRLGPFGDEQTRLLQLLMPHLQRALQLHTRIAGLESNADSASEALDRLPIALIVVDAAGKVLLLNRQAQDILALNDGLSLGRNGLVTPRPEQTNRLRGLIQGAIAAASGYGIDSGGAISIPRPSLSRPFQVLVTPLRSRTSARWPGNAAAAIFVTDPESRIEPPVKVFGRLFGLTPAEARLAGALMQGNSLTEAAEEFHLSRNTVRSQLRRILEKTGTARQGELIRLLWSSPAQIKLD